jgi:hypothetical protein
MAHGTGNEIRADWAGMVDTGTAAPVPPSLCTSTLCTASSDDCLARPADKAAACRWILRREYVVLVSYLLRLCPAGPSRRVISSQSIMAGCCKHSRARPTWMRWAKTVRVRDCMHALMHVHVPVRLGGLGGGHISSSRPRWSEPSLAGGAGSVGRPGCGCPLPRAPGHRWGAPRRSRQLTCQGSGRGA